MTRQEIKTKYMEMRRGGQSNEQIMQAMSDDIWRIIEDPSIVIIRRRDDPSAIIVYKRTEGAADILQ